MKIERHDLKRMTLSEFADKEKLVMKIHERNAKVGDPSRYYAYFKDVERREGNLLIGTYGNGSTPEEAMLNYIPEISGKWLVCGAMRIDRRDIVAPVITELGKI